jgi:DNA topoisomerase-1
VVLSGTRDDGAAGLAMIKAHGGAAGVQDPKDALYAGMPRSALASAEVDAVVPCERVAEVVIAMVNGDELPPGSRPPHNSGGKDPIMRAADLPGVEAPVTTICPECGGVLGERHRLISPGPLRRARSVAGARTRNRAGGNLDRRQANLCGLGPVLRRQVARQVRFGVEQADGGDARHGSPTCGHRPAAGSHGPRTIVTDFGLGFIGSGARVAGWLMRRAPRTPRLRRSDCSAPGLRRVRRGRGFAFQAADGQPVVDDETLERIRGLGIPPAWSDVWICGDPNGHLQATGIDGAGRKQYLYHPVWRELRDRQKFETMEEFAVRLPRLRRRVSADLQATGQLSQERVLACAARMLDVGFFRIGGEEYAKEDGGVGLATLRREHVSFDGSSAVFSYPAKSGVARHHSVADPDVVGVLRPLQRRRSGPAELLAYRSGRHWEPLHSDDISDYVKRHLGDEFSAKDFRTWNATVLAAMALARHAQDERSQRTQTSRKRVQGAVAREVAEVLGNTPAVARRSYIDPRVFDRYTNRWTINDTLESLELGRLDEASEQGRRRVELAVLKLLDNERDVRALRHLPAAA